MLKIAVSLGGWMQNWPEFSGCTVESCFVIGFWLIEARTRILGFLQLAFLQGDP